MSLNQDGQPEFCPGCPSQKFFVGGLKADSPSVTVKKDGNEGFAVDLSFVDPDGIESEKLLFSLSTNKLEEQGVEVVRDDRNEVTNHRALTDGVKTLTNITASRMVSRIGRCAGVGIEVGKVGELELRYCPAFNQSALREMFYRVHGDK